jgi:hypothetical protein
MWGALVILFAIAAFVFAWLWLMAIRSPCPSCGHRHQVIRIGTWLYPRFTALNVGVSDTRTMGGAHDANTGMVVPLPLLIRR